MNIKVQALAAGSGPSPAWTDEDLLHECRNGNQQAWSALVDKYKHLVYSIPLKYQASPEDAADIFQSVWLELYAELPRLRKAGAVRAWLIQVTTHQCFHWKRKRQQESARCSEGEDVEALAGEVVSPRLVEEVEKEQILRESVAALSARCREMIRMLFYEQPAVPYCEVARRLGLAVGSIGFIRGRCLERLKKALVERGF